MQVWKAPSCLAPDLHFRFCWMENYNWMMIVAEQSNLEVSCAAVCKVVKMAVARRSWVKTVVIVERSKTLVGVGYVRVKLDQEMVKFCAFSLLNIFIATQKNCVPIFFTLIPIAHSPTLQAHTQHKHTCNNKNTHSSHARIIAHASITQDWLQLRIYVLREGT